MACRACAVCFLQSGVLRHKTRRRIKKRGKEMDKSPGCDHQYPHCPKPRENSLKDSEFNICIMEVICTKRMLPKWWLFFLSVCVRKTDQEKEVKVQPEEHTLFGNAKEDEGNLLG